MKHRSFCLGLDWQKMPFGMKAEFMNTESSYSYSLFEKSMFYSKTWLQLNLISGACHTGQKQHNWIVSIIHLCMCFKMC